MSSTESSLTDFVAAVGEACWDILDREPFSEEQLYAGGEQEFNVDFANRTDDMTDVMLVNAILIAIQELGFRHAEEATAA